MPALPPWSLDSHLRDSSNGILLQWHAAVACVCTKDKASDLALMSDRWQTAVRSNFQQIFPFRKIASSLQAGLGVEMTNV